MQNPFELGIAADPNKLAADADVPDIHRDAFLRVCHALDAVVASRRSRSILIHGEPGSGKTHLIGRIHQHLKTERPDAVFVYVRMDRSAYGMAGSILREVGRALTRPRLHNRCLMDEIARRRLAGIEDGAAWLAWFDSENGKSEKTEHSLRDRIESIGDDCNLDRDFRVALGHMVAGHRQADVRAWLRGESLPDAVLTELGIADERENADPDLAARARLIGLARLAGVAFPFVFCFDQLEALQSFQGDESGLFAFGQTCSLLVDQTDSILAVSCVQSSFLVGSGSTAKGLPGVRAADMARVAGDRLALPALTWPQARQLIQVRLDFCPDIAAQRREWPDLWPLDETALRTLVDSNRCTPRELIERCKHDFESGLGRPLDAIESLERTIEREFQDRRDRPNVDDTTETLLHGLPMLANATGEAPIRTWDGDKDIELRMTRGGAEIGISVCNQRHKSLTTRLQRLRKGIAEGRIARLVVVRDADRLIPTTSKMAREHWHALEGDTDRVEVIRPRAEALAALEAMRRLLSDGRSGEIHREGKTIADHSLLEWLRANLPGELKELWNDFVGEEPGAGKDCDATLLEKCSFIAQQCRVLPLAEMAEKSSADVAEIDAIVRAREDLFGVLNGPPAVVYDRSGQAAPPSAAVPE